MNQPAPLTIARSELILGGQKSGKSRRAEALAAQWLRAPGHGAVLIATAQARDDEMRARIARHQAERAARVSGLRLIEEASAVPAAIMQAGGAETLRVVDCLTLWLAQRMEQGASPAEDAEALADAITRCPGPVVLVSNEIGLGVIPMGREVRAFVDALGLLNQRAAAACERVTLMAAGLPLVLKGDCSGEKP
ncbi:MAG: bifunctional adenosylcobinamide kinase/adenosylcobinamide-phosphate guanylyltransferase [Ottowia sp.]|nr:bifunctional adenosylcobinamide kinase/adenosylcobinamide-phosphate guanylyltransferase [Ottowia sp.]MBQ9578899.1 bifunctional adenosylcobinamide kinase/adenosylcobinamide-phosphate guanylyltransferase [Ottowia sp.]